jgi:D-arginine dehydrogenase
MSIFDTDILIVGAGLAGAATAYHLARRGPVRIAMVEQEVTPGAHSSGRSATIVREHADRPAMQALLSAGAAALREGRLAAFERCGVMLVGMGSEAVCDHFPRARGIGCWKPDDGTVDAAGLLGTYLRGQQVHYETRVLGWQRDGQGLRVATDRGEIGCRLLVNAAGPWAGELGDLPLTPMNRHLFVTAPLDWVEPRWPCIWDGARGLYFRPESGGLLLCCCDETPARPGDYGEDPAVLSELARKLSDLQPDLGELAIRSSWVGQRVFAPDRGFVIGFDPRDRHVFHVAGLGGHGVTASPAVGRLAASLILGDAAPGDGDFAPGRLL